MADELRIGLSELLHKAMIEHDADFLKEGVRVLSQALMEMEVEEHVGAPRHERSAGPASLGAAQRIPGAILGHEGRYRGVEGAQGQRWRLLPLTPGAEATRREGFGGGGSRGVRARGLHP